MNVRIIYLDQQNRYLGIGTFYFTFNPLTTTELAFIIQIFREGSQRVPTIIDSFGQLFGIFQHFQKVLEQALEKEKKNSLPTVEELEK